MTPASAPSVSVRTSMVRAAISAQTMCEKYCTPARAVTPGAADQNTDRQANRPKAKDPAEFGVVAEHLAIVDQHQRQPERIIGKDRDLAETRRIGEDEDRDRNRDDAVTRSSGPVITQRRFCDPHGDLARSRRSVRLQAARRMADLDDVARQHRGAFVGAISPALPSVFRTMVKVACGGAVGSGTAGGRFRRPGPSLRPSGPWYMAIFSVSPSMSASACWRPGRPVRRPGRSAGWSRPARPC